MSRGLGKLQRSILAWLGAEAAGVCCRDVVEAMTPHGTPYNPDGLRASVHRAIHALVARGLAETDWGFVGTGTPWSVGGDQFLLVRLPRQPWPSHVFGRNQYGTWPAAVAAWRAWCKAQEDARPKKLRATSSTAVDEVALRESSPTLTQEVKRYVVPRWDDIALKESSPMTDDIVTLDELEYSVT